MTSWKQRYAGKIIPMGYTKGKEFICHQHITEGNLRFHGFQPSFKKHKPDACAGCKEVIEAEQKKSERKTS